MEIILNILFWVFALIVFYSYVGYGILIFLLDKIKLAKFLPKPANAVKSDFVADENQFFPFVSFIISASGESKNIFKEKIQNTYFLNYPKNKMEVIFAIAYDSNADVDDTLNEYYNHFLNDNSVVDLKIADQEVYFRFAYLDSDLSLRDKITLDKIESDLNSVPFNSEDVTSGAKNHLDNHITEKQNPRELTVRITKDIKRKGKISQVNRTVKNAKGEILVFSDCNSMFNSDAIANLVRHFRNIQIGCVAGEKRVRKGINSTSGEGEGLYWKYESVLKKTDSKIWTTVGAAGEIFAIRKNLWGDGVDEDAIIEDFLVSMKVAEKGYRVIYEPDAYAEEEPTTDLGEEFKRRTRIAAGGFQSIVRLKSLLNLFKYRVLTFQYVSHRVLRWAVVPFLFPLLLIINVLILLFYFSFFYLIIMALQVSLYLFAGVGHILERKRRKIKIFYLPYLIMMMNVSAFVGLKRYLKNEQKTVWERAKR